MKGTFVTCLAILGCIFTTLYAAPNNHFLQSACKNTLDCPAGFCCMYTLHRYSVPSCKPKPLENGICRPNDNGHTTTLYYPYNQTLRVVNVYTGVCPCDSSLTCPNGVCVSESGPQEGVRID